MRALRDALGPARFDAEDVSLTLARVLERDVDFTPMPAKIPSRVRQVVALCLRKDVRQRISDIRDVRLALEGAFDTTSGLSPATTAPRSARLRLGALAIVAALALVAAAALAFVHFRETPAAPRSVSFQFPAPEKSVIATFDLSPDGRYVAFVTRGESSKLWVRPIDSLDAQELPGTDGARPARVRCSGHLIAAPSGSSQTGNSRRCRSAAVLLKH